MTTKENISVVQGELGKQEVESVNSYSTQKEDEDVATRVFALAKRPRLICGVCFNFDSDCTCILDDCSVHSVDETPQQAAGAFDDESFDAKVNKLMMAVHYADYCSAHVNEKQSYVKLMYYCVMKDLILCYHDPYVIQKTWSHVIGSPNHLKSLYLIDACVKKRSEISRVVYERVSFRDGKIVTDVFHHCDYPYKQLLIKVCLKLAHVLKLSFDQSCVFLGAAMASRKTRNLRRCLISNLERSFDFSGISQLPSIIAYNQLNSRKHRLPLPFMTLLFMQRAASLYKLDGDNFYFQNVLLFHYKGVCYFNIPLSLKKSVLNLKVDLQANNASIPNDLSNFVLKVVSEVALRVRASEQADLEEIDTMFTNMRIGLVSSGIDDPDSSMVELAQAERRFRKNRRRNKRRNVKLVSGSMLVPVSCGIAANLIAKMSVPYYNTFVLLVENYQKREFKRVFKEWCVTVGDRRFNQWSKFYKHLALNRGVKSVNEYFVDAQADDLDTTLEFFKEYMNEFLLMVAIMRSFMSKDFVTLACLLGILYKNEKIRELLSLIGEFPSGEENLFSNLMECFFENEPMKSDEPMKNFSENKVSGVYVVEEQADIGDGSSLLKKLSSVLSLLMNSSLIKKFGNGVAILTIATTVVSEIGLAQGIFKAIVEFLKLFYNRIKTAYDTGDWRVLLKGSRHDWALKARLATGKSDRQLRAQGFMSMSYDDQIKQCNDLIAEGEKLIPKDNMTIEENVLMRSLIDTRDYIVGLTESQKERKEPLGIILFGPSGVGKSTVAKTLALLICQHEKIPFKPSDLYEVPQGDKHWNNCENPKVVNFNDVTGEGHVKSPGETSLAEELRRAVDINPYWTLQAFLNKGMVINPAVIFVSTNDPVLDFSKLGSNWAKLLRRYRHCYYVSFDNSIDASCGVEADYTTLNRMHYTPVNLTHNAGRIGFVNKDDTLDIVGYANFIKHIHPILISHLTKVKMAPNDSKCPLFIPEALHIGFCENCPYSTDEVELPTEIRYYNTLADLDEKMVQQKEETIMEKVKAKLAVQSKIGKQRVRYGHVEEQANIPAVGLTYIMTAVVFVLKFVLHIFSMAILEMFMIFAMSVGLLIMFPFASIRWNGFSLPISSTQILDSLRSYFIKLKNWLIMIVINKFKAISMNKMVEFFKNWIKYVAMVVACIVGYFISKYWSKDDRGVKADEQVMANPIPLKEVDLKFPIFSAYKNIEPVANPNPPKYATYIPTMALMSDGLLNNGFNDVLNMVNNNTYIASYPKSEHIVSRVLLLNSTILVMNNHVYNAFKNKGYPIILRKENTQVTPRFEIPLDVDKVIDEKNDLVFLNISPIPAKNLIPHLHISSPTNSTIVIDGVELLCEKQSVILNLPENRTKEFDNMYTYAYTKKGACGLPIVCKDTTRENPHGAILGIHGFGNDTSGFAIPLSKNYVLSKTKDFKSINIDPMIHKHFDVIPQVGANCNMLTLRDCVDPVVLPAAFVGTLGPNVKKQSKSEVRKTQFHDILINDFVEKKVIPNLQLKGRLVGEFWQSPFTHKVDGYNPGVTNISQTVLDKCVSDYLTGAPKPEPCQPMSLEQAVNGVMGDSLIGGINLNTSSGAIGPFITSKRDIVDRENITEELASSVSRIIETMRDGKLIYNYNRWCLKDEPVSESKNERLKFRWFMITETPILLVCRMFLGPLIRHMYLNKEFYECYGAYNPASPDFEELYRKIDKRLIKLFLDLSHMDTSHKVWMSHLVAVIFQKTALEAGYSEKDALVCYLLAYSCIMSLSNINNDLFLFLCGLPSGHFLTFIFNCISLSLLFRYAYYYHTIMRPLFRLSNSLGTGGDDSAFSSDDLFMTGSHIARVFTELGYAPTPASDKNGNIQDNEPISNFVFLKRRPRKFFYNGRETVIGVLELDSILKNLCFILPSRVQSQEDQMLQKIDAAVRELALHESHIFDKYTMIIKNLYPNFNICPQEYYLNKYYNCELYDQEEKVINSFDVDYQADVPCDEVSLVMIFHSLLAFSFFLILSEYFVLFNRSANMSAPIRFMIATNPLFLVASPIIGFFYLLKYNYDKMFLQMCIFYILMVSFFLIIPYSNVFHIIGIVVVGAMVEEAYILPHERFYFAIMEFFMYVGGGASIVERIPAIFMHTICSKISRKHSYLLHVFFNILCCVISWSNDPTDELCYIMHNYGLYDQKMFEQYSLYALQKREFRKTNSSITQDHPLISRFLGSSVYCISELNEAYYRRDVGFSSKASSVENNISLNIPMFDLALENTSVITDKSKLGMATHTRPGQDIAFSETLSRAIRIGQHVWTPTSTAVVDIAANLYTLWQSDPFIYSKLLGYRYFRGKPKLIFVVNGFSWYFGNLVLACDITPGFVFDDKLTTTTNNVVNDVFAATTVPHVRVDPSKNATYELRVPWLASNDWYDRNNSTTSPALKLSAFLLHPLASATEVAAGSVHIQIYFSMEDVSVSGAVWSAPQSLAYTKEDYKMMNEQDNTTEATLEEEDKPLVVFADYQADVPTELKEGGMLSNVASTAGNVFAKAAQAMPTNPYLTPLAMGSKHIARVLNALGYSSPPTLDHTLTKELTATVHYSGNERDSSIRCVDDIKQSVAITPEAASVGDPSDLTILGIAKKPGLIYASTYTSGTTVKVDCNPMQSGKLATSKWRLTPLAHMSAVHRFWSGSLVFTINFVCSTFHRGQMGITWSPDFTIPTNVRDLAKFAKTVYVDLSGSVSVDFEVPYQSWPGALRVSNTPDAVGTETNTNGYLLIYEVNPVVSSGSTAPIYVNVSIRAGDDFKLFKVIEPRYRYDVVYQGDDDDHVTDDVEVGKPQSVKFSAIFYGEETQTIKSLVSKSFYSNSFTASQTAGWKTLTIPTQYSRVSGVPNMMFFIGLGFLTQRGGFRTKIVFNNINPTFGPYDPTSSIIYLTTAASPVDTTSYALSSQTAIPPIIAGFSGTGGVAVHNRWDSPVFELEVPNINRSRFFNPRAADGTDLYLTGTILPHLSFYFPAATTVTISGLTIFESAADDFSLYGYWAPPVVIPG